LNTFQITYIYSITFISENDFDSKIYMGMTWLPSEIKYVHELLTDKLD
jgi:hypothetical protein